MDNRRLVLTRRRVTYIQQLLTTDADNLVALWSLGETSGTSARDVKGGFDGTYNGAITLDAIRFPDGTSAPLFDASADVVSLPVATLDTPFDPTLGTLAIWCKVRAASVWTDGVARTAFHLGASGANRLGLGKSAGANSVNGFYSAGGTVENPSNSGYSPTRWFHQAMTWNKAADRMRFFVDGVQVGADQTTLGVWAGALSNSWSAIANFTGAGGTSFWDGYLKYAGLWKSELTPTQLAALVPANFLV